MIYSVWQPSKQTYDYYRTTEGYSDDGPRPRARGGSKIGCSPEEVSWRLPVGAVFAGRGRMAKGVVVHAPTGGSALGNEDDDFFKNTFWVVGLGFVALMFVGNYFNE